VDIAGKEGLMKVAIVHPWFIAAGGAEQTVGALAEIYPNADFFTMLYTCEGLPSKLRGRTIRASSWNKLPFKYHIYRYLLPLYPLGFESLDLRGYNLILTSDSTVAKGIVLDQNAIHICYCHSPMRCLWDLRHEYLRSMPALIRPIFRVATHYVRQWDYLAAQRVDAFIANSQNVAERIQTYYGRSSTVIFPPVDTLNAAISSRSENYYFTAGRLVKFKRVDLLIQACNDLKRNLIIAGAGRDEKRLQKMAGPTISFVGRVSPGQLHRLYSRCRAFLFAADEDFGIVPVEAQSFGRPVIAYGKGGVLETVLEASADGSCIATGIHFAEATAHSIQTAILHFESIESSFDPEAIRRHALQFDTASFAEKIKSFVDKVINDKRLEKNSSKVMRLYRQSSKEFLHKF